MEIEPPDSLYGLYEGTPITEREWTHGNALPDRITLFQRPIEEDSRGRGRGARRHRRDADPRGRALLRSQRRRDRGHRGAVLARRARWARTTTSRDPAARTARSRPAARRANASASTSWSRRGSPRSSPAWTPQPTDRFIEIGPGRGALTRPLAPRVAELVAVEIDRDLAAHLAATSPARPITRR